MSLTQLSDLVLVSNFKDLLIENTERFVVELEYLAELDRRKLYFEYSSLWAYLVEECGMEDSAAGRRIRAARLLKRFPTLKGYLESGRLNLSLLEYAQACAARQKLDDHDFWDLLESIAGMSCRAAKREIASRYPVSQDLTHDQIRPINGEFSEVRFAASQELLEKLDEIRGLLAHSHPGLTMAELIDVLASDYRERNHPEAKAERARLRESKKTESVGSPSTSKVIQSEERNPTQPVVHALTRSHGYVCSYVDPQTGKACTSTYALEIDHVQAWALGGSTELQNLRYLCRNHHKRISFLQFGEPQTKLSIT